MKTTQEIINETLGSYTKKLGAKNQKWFSEEEITKVLESKRNISDICYTHRNDVINLILEELFGE